MLLKNKKIYDAYIAARMVEITKSPAGDSPLLT